MTVSIPDFTLANGVKMPAIAGGFGVRSRDGFADDHIDTDLVSAIKGAISVGVYNLDGAQLYLTEPEMGAAISGVDRESLFITTKVMHEYADPLKALDTSLAKLKTDYVDLYLIHSPFNGHVVEQWKALETAYKQGKARAIGVSNFKVEHLEQILAVAEIKPVVNQIEYHPYLQNQSPGIVKFCQDHDIRVVAYGSLVPVTKAKEGPLTAVLEKLSKKYKKDAGQLVLRWIYETGVIPIASSHSKERLRGALDIFSFEFDKADHDEITTVGASYPVRAFYREPKYFDKV